jgi:hypothetical protein
VSGALSALAAERRRCSPHLQLAQFICSFAGSNMNVMISDSPPTARATVKSEADSIRYRSSAVFPIPASTPPPTASDA